MALFILLIVGVVMAQTWVDWRDAHKHVRIPDWAKGTAWAGVLAVSLTLAASYASAWIQGNEHFGSGANSSLLWPEIAFLACTMGFTIAAVRNKRFRWLFVAAGILVGILWIDRKSVV